MFIDYSRPVIELHFFAHMPDLVPVTLSYQELNKGLGIGVKFF